MIDLATLVAMASWPQDRCQWSGWDQDFVRCLMDRGHAGLHVLVRIATLKLDPDCVP